MKILDRINIAALAAILLFILACWILLHAGFDNPAQRYFIGRLPAYVPEWQWSTLLLALAICAGWLLLLLNTRLSLVQLAWRWSGGVIAIGLLFDLLWRAYIALSLNHTAMIYDMEAHLPQQYDCIASFDIGESLRGMIHYRSAIVVQDWMLLGDEVLACELRLLRENQLQLVEEGDWRLVWRGSRPGDGKVYSVYQGSD